MSRFFYTHAPNSSDGYDYLFRDNLTRDCQDVFDWCVIQFGKPDGLREDRNKKWTAGTWSFIFADEADAMWFRMWFC
jgi:hypothetical protein